MYSVSSLKTFVSDGVVCLEATLQRDGTTVATIKDKGLTGDLVFQWHCTDQACERLKWAVYISEQLLKTSSLTLLHENADEIEAANRLIEKFREEKNLRHLCQSRTLFTLRSPTSYSFLTLNKMFNPQVKQELVSIYGGRLSEIINERFSDLTTECKTETVSTGH